MLTMNGRQCTDDDDYLGSDQELLNCYYRDRWCEIPYGYNFRLRGVFNSSVLLHGDHMRMHVFHFAGDDQAKPWLRERTRELTYFALLWWMVFDFAKLQLADALVTL